MRRRWAACRPARAYTKVLDFGAFVEVLPGIEGLCHVSELDVTRVNNPKDVVNEGDRIDVKLLETNERGQLKLSRREVLLDEGGDGSRAQLEAGRCRRTTMALRSSHRAKLPRRRGDAVWGRRLGRGSRRGTNPDDRRRGRPPPKPPRGRTRLRE